MRHRLVLAAVQDHGAASSPPLGTLAVAVRACRGGRAPVMPSRTAHDAARDAVHQLCRENSTIAAASNIDMPKLR